MPALHEASPTPRAFINLKAQTSHGFGDFEDVFAEAVNNAVPCPVNIPLRRGFTEVKAAMRDFAPQGLQSPCTKPRCVIEQDSLPTLSKTTENSFFASVAQEVPSHFKSTIHTNS